MITIPRLMLVVLLAMANLPPAHGQTQVKAEVKAQLKSPNWVKSTADAGWRARDSSGEIVFKDQLWILGGWFDSFQSPPRDVWSSRDGANWSLVQNEAPWKYSDLPMTIAFKDRMWVMGGWTNGRLAWSHLGSRHECDVEPPDRSGGG